MGNTTKVLVDRRKQRNRFRIMAKRSADRPRLSVFRSNKHIYAQVIDDIAGKTVASASTKDKEIAATLKAAGNADAAAAVGKLIAERAKAANVKTVAFDRGPYIYHGRVKALAEAAREGGLSF